ncbi:MAG TPA: hypothetical protein PKC98_06170 [Candidatus Melainabacteria bacterium]|nr:hypothetical protein [Candidatus Melainabacteria bacterium]
MSQKFQLNTDDLDSIKGVDTHDMHAQKVMGIVEVILARIDGYSDPSFLTVTDVDGNFVQVAGGADAFYFEWGSKDESGAIKIRVAGHLDSSGYPFALFSSNAHFDLSTDEILNTAEVTRLVSAFVSGGDLKEGIAWREIVAPLYGIKYAAVIAEPQFLDQSWVYRIVFKGQNSELYKPVEFRSERELWSCLNDFGVFSLREFGNKVEWLDCADVELLKKWRAVRDTIPFKKKQVKSHLEVLLGEYVDPIFIPLGFKRRKRSLDYKRVSDKSEQQLRFDFDIRHGRLDLSVFSRIFAIEKLLEKILAEPLKASSINSIDSLHYGPVEARQYGDYMQFYDKQSLTDLFDRLRDFFQSDMAMYFDIFSSADKLITAFENSDPVLLKQGIDKFAGILVAAYLVAGNYDSARSVINEFRAMPDFRLSAATDELEKVVRLAEFGLSFSKLNGD